MRLPVVGLSIVFGFCGLFSIAAVPCAVSSARAVELRAADPLPSWNASPARSALVDFVTRTTTAGSADFIPPAERIATFDNDGTLWCEQPLYVQAFFIVDRVKQLAPAHPEWREKQPFQAILTDDRARLAQLTEQDLVEAVMATHAGVSTAEFDKIVTAWITTARHPRFDRPFTQLVYQPMLEVLEYLRASGFETFIVSGGGIEFMRTFADKSYGIPPYKIIGSSVGLRYELAGDKPLLMRQPQVAFIDDKSGKPVGIQNHIGRRPVIAFGNSDGDLEMLEWTTLADGPRLGLIVHHTDAEREYAYDRQSPVGRLDKALDAAPKRGWQLIDMRRDWSTIFPPAK